MFCRPRQRTPLGIRPVQVLIQKIADLTFRVLRPEDLELLVRMDAECFPGSTAYSETDMKIVLGLKGSAGEIAFSRGKAAGFVIWAGNHVITLDVLPEFRRKKIGEALMKRAFSEMRRAGCGRVYLEVDCDNAQALSLYGKLGFITVATFREMGRMRFLMSLDL